MDFTKEDLDRIKKTCIGSTETSDEYYTLDDICTNLDRIAKSLERLIDEKTSKEQWTGVR